MPPTTRATMRNGFLNLVPSKLFDSLYSEIGSDEFLSEFNGDGLAEIPIGRIPARTAANVTLVLNKVTTFEQSLSQAVSRGALCVSDLPEGYDFSAVCNRVFAELTPNFNKTFINRGDLEAHNLLMNSLNAGKYIVNYTGHERLRLGRRFVLLQQFARYRLTTTAIYHFYNAHLSERLFRRTGNFIRRSRLFARMSAVAAWASSGLTTRTCRKYGKTLLQKTFRGNINRLEI